MGGEGLLYFLQDGNKENPIRNDPFQANPYYTMNYLILLCLQIKDCIFTSPTSPCLSDMLFVSFSLWKFTTLDIHCSPVAGLSGWMYIRLGISGSAFPATIHRELWNLYLQSSAATMSINKIYLDFLSKPAHLALNGGNMRLQRRT